VEFKGSSKGANYFERLIKKEFNIKKKLKNMKFAVKLIFFHIKNVSLDPRKSNKTKNTHIETIEETIDLLFGVVLKSSSFEFK
jgi:hypothetical protein